MKLRFLLAVLLTPAPAFAGVLTINSPDVKKGEFSLEAGISLESDDQRQYDHYREHVMEIGYSPTDYWNTAMEFTAEREAGEGTRYAVTGWENTFQFIKQSEAKHFRSRSACACNTKRRI